MIKLLFEDKTNKKKNVSISKDTIIIFKLKMFYEFNLHKFFMILQKKNS